MINLTLWSIFLGHWHHWGLVRGIQRRPLNCTWLGHSRLGISDGRSDIRDDGIRSNSKWGTSTLRYSALLDQTALEYSQSTVGAERADTASMETPFQLPALSPNRISLNDRHVGPTDRVSQIFPPRTRTPSSTPTSCPIDVTRVRLGTLLSLDRFFPPPPLSRSTPIDSTPCPLPQTRTRNSRIRQRVDFPRFTRSTLNPRSSLPSQNEVRQWSTCPGTSTWLT